MWFLSQRRRGGAKLSNEAVTLADTVRLLVVAEPGITITITFLLFFVVVVVVFSLSNIIALVINVKWIQCLGGAACFTV